MSVFTWNATYDNTQLHAMQVPSNIAFLLKVTMREQAQDAAPVAYDVASPGASFATNRMYAGETAVFRAKAAEKWSTGATFGYVQPTSGTITYTFYGEDVE